MPYRNFIIICEIRTGSTYLSRFLNGVDSIKMWTKSDDDDASFEVFRSEEGELSTIREFYSTKFDGSLGTKLPIRHSPRNRTFVCVEIKARCIRPIYIYREDKVAHLLSIIHAEHTSLWHTNSDKGKTGEPIFIDIDDVAKTWIPQYKYYQKELKKMRSILKTSDSIEVTYEGITKGDDKKIIVESLGIDWKDSYDEIDNEKKILKGNPEMYFENYSLVKTVIEEELDGFYI